MGNGVVGYSRIVQQFFRTVARQVLAAFTDKFHGPVFVVAAAVNHAVELRQQHLQHLLSFWLFRQRQHVYFLQTQGLADFDRTVHIR